MKVLYQNDMKVSKDNERTLYNDAVRQRLMDSVKRIKQNYQALIALEAYKYL